MDKMLWTDDIWVVTILGAISTACILLAYYVFFVKRTCFRWLTGKRKGIKLDFLSCFRKTETICWCCQKRISNKERISKELVKSFSYENPNEVFNIENNDYDDDIIDVDDIVNDGDDEDDEDDDTTNCDEDDCIIEDDYYLQKEGQEYVDDQKDLMKKLQPKKFNRKISDQYYMTKLNQCLNETNRWYQRQNELINENNAIINHQSNNSHNILMMTNRKTSNEDEDERESLLRSQASLPPQHNRHRQQQKSTNKRCIQRQQSICINDDNNAISLDLINKSPATNHHQNNNRSRNLLKQQAIYASFALKNNTKSIEMFHLSNQDNNNNNNGNNNNGREQQKEENIVKKNNLNNINIQSGIINGNDLISLAEKGRIGKQTSTDGSISSETGSAEDSSMLNNKTINKNFNINNNNINRRTLFKRFNTESSETTTESIQTNKDGQTMMLSSNHNNNNNHKYQALNNYFENYYESDTQSSNLPDFSPNATLSERNLASSIMVTNTNTTTTTATANNNNNNNTINSTININNKNKNKSSVGGLNVIGLGGGGRLEISFAYDAPTKKLYVTVIQGDELPHKEQMIHTASVCQIYVKVILLPQKKQKFKTKSKPIFCPVFDETFTFNRINPQDISEMGLRFRVFSMGLSRKTHLIGECRLAFARLKPQQQETKLWFTLELPSKRNRLSDLESSSLARTDSTSSQSLQQCSSPELLLGLSYNGTTGRLSVTIIKGSQFRCLSTRAPDTYIKVLLVSQNGNEMARGKTKVCRGQPNPLFRDTFVFQVALFQLPDVTLMIFVYNKRSIKRKELIGWISLGYNSSGDEEMSHWNDMRDNKGEQVSRWHLLNEPS